LELTIARTPAILRLQNIFNWDFAMTTSQIVEFLVSAALKAPSADNTQPWHFTWDGDYLLLSYDFGRVSGLTFQPDNPAILLSVGAVIENLVQVADCLGLKIEFEESSETDQSVGIYSRIKVNFEESSQLLPECKGLPLFSRHTNRFSFKSIPLPDHLISSIATDHEQDAHAAAITDPDKVTKIARLICNASEIRFQTKEIHEWLFKSLRFNSAEVNSGDGLDVSTLDLPPGGGLFFKFIADWRRMSFLNRLGVYKLMSLIESAPIGKAPALVAISSPVENRQIIAAGRLLTRIWIRLNEEGVAVHPYYVIPDQLIRLQQEQIPEKLLPLARELAAKTEEIFGFEDEAQQLRMLFRIGYPKKNPTRSERLPLNRVYTETAS
jgi:hypothetical protein